jgi:histidyl-tRNA synthetase
MALREWEYYSGMIFELYSADDQHLAGGGRYDDFARLLGAPVDLPAVGFVYYLDALSANHDQQVSRTYVLTNQYEYNSLAALRWASMLREHGVTIVYHGSNDTGPGDLTVISDGHLRFRDSTYSLEQSAMLLTLLREK